MYPDTDMDTFYMCLDMDTFGFNEDVSRYTGFDTVSGFFPDVDTVFDQICSTLS